MESAARLLIALSDGAQAPSRASEHAAGYDLRAGADVVVPPWERVLVPTGLKMALSPNTMGEIRSRSGLAAKSGIFAFHGIVDSDYRGEVHVLLISMTGHPFGVKKGERIAQLVVVPVVHPTVEVAESLPESLRGQGGFGSSGKA